MLTLRQKQILDFINKYNKRHGISPSLEEIKKHFRLRSVSGIHQHLEALKNKGYLNKAENQPRGIEINKREKSPKTITIPLFGVITAGEPVEAYEIPEKIIVPKNLVSNSGNHFALKVNGNSMIGDGIFDGDTVIIRKQQTAENGETVVALINDSETTLKKIYKEKNGFRLQPANPELKPIFVKKLIIQGKVVSVIRNFEEQKEPVKDDGEFEKTTIDYINKTNIEYRKSLGQYFTPKSIREKLLSKLPNSIKSPEVLDPACGTGEFLLSAKKYFKNPKIYGWDIDKKLTEISKKTVPEANLKNIDSLLNDDYGRFDFVIGNPPYFEFNPSPEIRKKFREIINGRINIFSLFVYQGVKWLKEGGYLAYVIPPSMNNGAYFKNLRKFIIENTNIEYLHVLKDPKLFNGALQSTMLLVLKKGKNKGDYIFKKNGLVIFSEGAEYLKKTFENKITLKELNFNVRTGKMVWNQNRNILTHNKNEGIPLIWAHNIQENGLKFPIYKEDKPQYVKTKKYDFGPAIVVNRITGSINSMKLKAALIPTGMKFIAENHVNVIYPPSKKSQLGFDFSKNSKQNQLPLDKITKQLASKEKLEALKNITGNTQISKTELENLFPISI
jgi:adenine-specific DNA-methyltransferase